MRLPAVKLNVELRRRVAPLALLGRVSGSAALLEMTMECIETISFFLSCPKEKTALCSNALSAQVRYRYIKQLSPTRAQLHLAVGFH